MKRSLLVALAAAVALSSGATAQASLATENSWSADTLIRVNATMESRSVQMSAGGRGIYFYGGQYRDYDSATDSWTDWQRLARDPDILISNGNARGDVCATWWADFGLAAACRPAGSTTWTKRNIAATRGATAESIDVSADGTSALVTWWLPAAGRTPAILKASTYTFATRTWSRAATVNIRQDRGRLVRIHVAPMATPAGAGYLLAYVVGRKGPRRTLIAEATFRQVWTPGRGWGRQAEILLAPPGGTPKAVVMAALDSDGTVTAAAFGHEPPTNVDLPSDDWWIARADTAGTFANPVPANATTYSPSVVVSGDTIVLIGKDAARDSGPYGSIEISVVSEGAVLRHRLEPPPLDGIQTHGWDVSFVAQKTAEDADGFALVMEVDKYVDGDDVSGTGSYDVQQLFTSFGYVDPAANTLQVSDLTRLGTDTAYDGMDPVMAGWGRHALISYTNQSDALAAVRVPPPP